jgi:hypothetical protein
MAASGFGSVPRFGPDDSSGHRWGVSQLYVLGSLLDRNSWCALGQYYSESDSDLERGALWLVRSDLGSYWRFELGHSPSTKFQLELICFPRASARGIPAFVTEEHSL